MSFRHPCHSTQTPCKRSHLRNGVNDNLYGGRHEYRLLANNRLEIVRIDTGISRVSYTCCKMPTEAACGTYTAYRWIC
ncbi:hypothetical protein TNCV_3044261 [Trichonephila clavipes]|nr:hypothetical protein TNCV_3044261 [Trichonephila clavipes]